ncbi:hypothetical protein [Mycobacteroides abscessus]|uniref:hypothetical protein n=2 Tax=Mycobacteroides abscessus TaxID=36809 RepID=UPI000C266C0C|nr:hypothetical protein [Mycobacteroides abscessus]
MCRATDEGGRRCPSTHAPKSDAFKAKDAARKRAERAVKRGTVTSMSLEHIAAREALFAITKTREDLAAGNYVRAYNGSYRLGRGGFGGGGLDRILGVVPTESEQAASDALDESWEAMRETLRPVADDGATPDTAAINAAVDAWGDAILRHQEGESAYEARIEAGIAEVEARIARGDTPLPRPSDADIDATFQELGIDPEATTLDYYQDRLVHAAEGMRKHEELQKQAAELSDPARVKAVQQQDKKLSAARKAFEEADRDTYPLSKREQRWADYLAANHPELEVPRCIPINADPADGQWQTLRSNSRDQKSPIPRAAMVGFMADYDAPRRSYVRCDRLGEVMSAHQKPSAPREFEHGNASADQFQVVAVEPTVFLHNGKTYQVVQFAHLDKDSPANATYAWGEALRDCLSHRDNSATD